MPREPKQIYAILAYSKSLNNTKRIFDEDELNKKYVTGTQEKYARQKADAFAARLNHQRHKGATDWVGKIQLQDYKPDGVTRGAQILTPQKRIGIK